MSKPNETEKTSHTNENRTGQKRLLTGSVSVWVSKTENFESGVEKVETGPSQTIYTPRTALDNRILIPWYFAIELAFSVCAAQ